MGRTKARKPPAGVGGRPEVERAGSVVGPDDEVVTLAVDERGAAFFAPMEPVALRRLSPLARDLLADLGNHADALVRMQEHLVQLVHGAREAGVSWHAIGWTLGMTGEGARRAYGGRYAGEID